jgi:D-alanyl-lipoteichoic acid acyltransferase DltB (MBOAT superfamily)
MIWGFFLKMVLADRAAIFVDTIYSNVYEYQGWYMIVGTLLFAVQIYCDFSGYSIIAMGAAKILGIQLMENFQAPYLSVSVSEFWRRWHISLTSWFRDYLYFPLGGSKKGLVRKHLNRMVVFLVSGLWHGASWSFVAWGGLNGLYQIGEDILKPVRDKTVALLGLKRESIGHRSLCICITNILICISWVFFRADGLSDAVCALTGMLTVHNPWILVDRSLLRCGLDAPNFTLLLISIGILFFADFCKKRGIVIRSVILKQDWWVRWLIFALSISAILLFGIWGDAYDATNFIYFQF